MTYTFNLMACKLMAFKFIGVALVLTFGFMEPAAAVGSMRCGTHIISCGQGKDPGQYEVLKRCGEPTVRQGNTWIYEKSSSVARRIRFDGNGMVSAIE